MIKAPSLRGPYNDHFSEDPAFLQLATDATPEQIAEYTAKLTAATETGNWSPLRVEGAGEPTTFVLRPIPSSAFGQLVDLQRGGTGENETLELAFRIALASVSNLGEAKVSFVEDPRFGRIASASFLETAGIHGALGVRIVREIGSRIIRRASDLGPK